MSDKPKVYVAGIGMITPVGFNADMTAAAVRAGVSGYTISGYKNWACKPITMATVPDEALPGICDDLDTSEAISVQIGRMLMMATIALEQVLEFYPDDKPLPLMLAVPESDPELEVPMSHAFIELLMTQTNIALDRANCRMIGAGRAGVIAGIDMAVKYLGQGVSDYVLVGGVDSYQDHDVLLKLAEQDRVMAEGSQEGFVPGEAAGFLLLTGKKNLAQQFGKYKIGISVPGLAQEVGHMYSEATYTGEGLANAVRTALDNHAGSRVNRIYSSMNGEHFWAKEHGVAMIRNTAELNELVTTEHPADCFGDIGAAMGAVLIGIAGLTLVKEGKAQSSLVYCSSDRAPRGAVCLELV